ncbi:MAG: hypothetical protein ACI4V2_07510 [Alloprevotella sp.]
MKKNLFPLFLLFLFVSPLTIKSQRPAAVQFVPADSVVAWGGGEADWRGMAVALFPDVTEKTFIPATSAKKLLKHWTKHTRPGLGVLGMNAATADGRVEADAALVDEAAQLFVATGRADGFEAMERVVHGRLLQLVQPSAGRSYVGHQAAQALTTATGRVYAVDDEGIWVNLFLNNTAQMYAAGTPVVVDQLTTMPYDGRVKIRLSGLRHGGYPLTVRVRVPMWAAGLDDVNLWDGWLRSPALPYVVYVNGREWFDVKIERGYVVIRRKWNSGDEVLFDLPVQPRWVDIPGRSHSKALRRGLLFYALPAEASVSVFGEDVEMEEVLSEAGLPDIRLRDKAGRVHQASPAFLTDGDGVFHFE